MAVSTQTTALIATFADRRRAERFVEELRREGFQNDEIGMVSPGPEPQESHVGEDAAAGALTGGVLGAFAGALATGLIPGVGPVIAAGLLAGVLGGGAAGAATGGVLGALIGLGVPEEEARRHEQAFQAGRTLVVVQSRTRNAEALAILRRLEREP
jgi:Heat induced stress protein YflT